MQQVKCINERKAISRQNQIEVGKYYYLDLSTVNGDYEGDWYGNIYADDKKEVYVGHLKLRDRKSVV